MGEGARARLSSVESTTRPGRRESSAQRSALAASYQVRAHGHISTQDSYLADRGSLALTGRAVSSLDRNAIAGQCGTRLGVKIPQMSRRRRVREILAEASIGHRQHRSQEWDNNARGEIMGKRFSHRVPDKSPARALPRESRSEAFQSRSEHRAKKQIQ